MGSDDRDSDVEKRSGNDRRTYRNRRSGIDTRSEEEKRATGERRTNVDRRSGIDRRKPKEPDDSKPQS